MSSTEDVSLFGWDLTYNSVKNDIKTKEDLLAVLIHWCLIKSGFRCVGVGESMESCESDQPSEVLPEGWNYTDNYALRYLFKGKLYNFAINKSGQGVVFINIIHKGQNTGLDLKLDDVIKSLTGPLDKQVPDYKNFIQKVQVNLVRVLTDEPTSSETQTTTPPRNTESRTRNPLYVDPPQRDPGFQPSPLQIRPPSPPWLDPLADPRQVGRADLDPFGGPGGGMLFNPPFNRPGVAPGSVPDGARFDPFRPDGLQPHPPPRRPPGSDHLPPPGYDDMFM